MFCRLIIAEEKNIARVNEPVTFGLPFPCGLLSETHHLSLIDQRDQHRRPLQVEALDHWPDGSVRWALLDFQATVAAGETAGYHLRTAPDSSPAEAPQVSLVQAQDAWTIDTGAARFSLNTQHAQAL